MPEKSLVSFDGRLCAAVFPAEQFDEALAPECDRALLTPETGEKRRREFLLGRACAREALKKLGLNTEGPIGRGDNGEPIWPDGVLGSISHTDGYAAAVVGSQTQFRAIGLDFELENRQMNPGISRRICSGNELGWVLGSPDPERQRICLLALFSAKEALYKAFAPHLRKFFGFHDVELEWNGKDISSGGEFLLSRSSTLLDPWLTPPPRLGILCKDKFLFAICTAERTSSPRPLTNPLF